MMASWILPASAAWINSYVDLSVGAAATLKLLSPGLGGEMHRGRLARSATGVPALAATRKAPGTAPAGLAGRRPRGGGGGGGRRRPPPGGRCPLKKAGGGNGPGDAPPLQRRG